MKTPWSVLVLFLCLVPNVYGQRLELQVEVVARNLDIPWALAFAPDGRAFFTERAGRVRILANGTVTTIASLNNVTAIGEGGLLGLALDPAFAQNHFVYVYHTYTGVQGTLKNRIVRFTESAGSLRDPRILLDGIPGESVHDGGRIKFGPDGKLYATAGDATQSQQAQDLNSLAGKVLRLNPDGSVPADNPFAGSYVFTYGHRNPQGLDWHPVTGRLYETEHGPVGHDEVNILDAGKNYGWPVVTGKASDPRFVDPLIETGSDTWAPSGATFYRGDRLPDLKGALLIATLRGQHLRVLMLSANFTSVASSIASLIDAYGRLRDVVQGPDGFLYILTNNRDGRGTPAPDDDKILRIVSAVIPEFKFELLLLPVALTVAVLAIKALSKTQTGPASRSHPSRTLRILYGFFSFSR